MDTNSLPDSLPSSLAGSLPGSLARRKKRRNSHLILFGIGWLVSLLTAALCGCRQRPVDDTGKKVFHITIELF